MNRCSPSSMLLVAGLLVSPAPTARATPIEATRIRPLDPTLRTVVAAGRSRSPTFRRLADRLDRGDLVVYVQYASLPDSIQGRLVFLSAVAGRRYVVIEVTRELDESRVIAIVGHELQHAVEVLEQPAIVDRASLARAYEQSGHERRHFANGSIGFDTPAAVGAGRQVLRELLGWATAVATR